MTVWKSWTKKKGQLSQQLTVTVTTVTDYSTIHTNPERHPADVEAKMKMHKRPMKAPMEAEPLLTYIGPAARHSYIISEFTILIYVFKLCDTGHRTGIWKNIESWLLTRFRPSSLSLNFTTMTMRLWDSFTTINNHQFCAPAKFLATDFVPVCHISFWHELRTPCMLRSIPGSFLQRRWSGGDRANFEHLKMPFCRGKNDLWIWAPGSGAG